MFMCDYRDLDDLKQLVIRNYPNTLFLEHLINQIRGKRVNELMLENLPHLIRQRNLGVEPSQDPFSFRSEPRKNHQGKSAPELGAVGKSQVEVSSSLSGCSKREGGCSFWVVRQVF